MSAGPPGPNGTTILTGRLGQAWPSAGEAATASDPINRLRRAMQCMMILPGCHVISCVAVRSSCHGAHARARWLRLLLLLLLVDLPAPALLLGFEEGGEDLADGALGDVAGDEHHAALAVVAFGPGIERGRRMEDMLHAVDYDRLVGVLDVQDALHAQEVGAAIGHQRIERRRHRRPAHRLVEGHAESLDAIVVAVDVVRVLLAVLVAMAMIVVAMAVMMMRVAAAVPVVVGLFVQPALHIGALGVGIVETGV